MRADGDGQSHFALPAIDHEANGPLSLLVRATTWALLIWHRRWHKRWHQRWHQRAPMFASH